MTTTTTTIYPLEACRFWNWCEDADNDGVVDDAMSTNTVLETKGIWREKEHLGIDVFIHGERRNEQQQTFFDTPGLYF